MEEIETLSNRDSETLVSLSDSSNKNEDFSKIIETVENQFPDNQDINHECSNPSIHENDDENNSFFNEPAEDEGGSYFVSIHYIQIFFEYTT